MVYNSVMLFSRTVTTIVTVLSVLSYTLTKGRGETFRQKIYVSRPVIGPFGYTRPIVFMPVD